MLSRFLLLKTPPNGTPYGSIIDIGWKIVDTYSPAQEIYFDELQILLSSECVQLLLLKLLHQTKN